ncbi:MAG: nucleotidyltransferase domain-containing protein [Firmicutes bacterium]|nr:nucleotidyltransferase domain-containing protein [Bacillota bacterium]
MTHREQLQVILAEYRRRLYEVLGDELDAVMLYGSQARGEAAEDSDIDVLCILKRPFNLGKMIHRTSKITAEISLAYDVVISRVFVTREDYETKRIPFLMNVRREAIPI